MSTPIEQLKQFVEWDQHNLDRLPESDLRLLVAAAIVDLAARTDLLLNKIETQAETVTN